ncbi:hypothetical protein F0U44_11230 [Nocardioides humilatus]|uniref:PknH-like extracellular domain-containing protein n=1 Tax=Nocardioides humilatus TaxID=2607660 RepID=A0A5B1LFS4_9ACTN|nr:hypothetical protein [Nocardioides humilatus]KAA1419028.1 hypothetical protein F0U44_11230 [Nocardioides humilatus]
MTRRSRFLGATLTIVCGLTLVGGATEAAPQLRAVDASDFPTVDQVAMVLPAYAGGERFVEGDNPIWIFQSDCSGYRNGPSGEVRKWAYYYAIESDQPANPRVHVQEFATVAAAKQAIRTIRNNAEGCYGTHHHASINGTLVRRAADVPRLGDGTPVAWKMNDDWTDIDTHLRNHYVSRRIWMREGDTVIGIDLWNQTVGPHEPDPISRRASIRLARLALRTAD